MEQKWGERLADLLELPRDVVMNLPRIVVTGNKRLIIENHKGVIEYAPNLLRLNTARGEVRITGANLVLLSILREEVSIEGQIQQVEFVDWEG
jgi:sporulation protein YqfC